VERDYSVLGLRATMSLREIRMDDPDTQDSFGFDDTFSPSPFDPARDNVIDDDEKDKEDEDLTIFLCALLACL
jgi:hypothetical protein